ncbi:hypothetical protein EXIGLDRAFT_720504 [Exidia glandulosa HHB12029]|uniref:Uncharacterized protein n=1 Tax=Exidia glandulosa HHB12029 TaxID=1314781 RepID=A0A165GDA6_EXIGL|nr:hypothetical protein EXIGLDRAFT_720504 [Exidia glandulosa HHB12029]
MRSFSFLLFAASAFAASCYSDSGCGNCESHDSMYAARQDFCGSDKWSFQNSEAWGDALISLSGHFDSPQSCWDGFAQIIDQCYGQKNGGTFDWDYNGNSAHLDVDFCSCR